MAIKAGELIHVGNSVLLDRLQNGGPGDLNIPTEKIFELGNYDSVATIRDIPDLSFSMESFDTSAEMEAMLTGGDFAADPAGTEYDIALVKYQDVAGQFKAGRNAANPFDIVVAAVLPGLFCESLSYRFGIRDNAAQTASLRGDSIYYAEGGAIIEEFAGPNTAAGGPIVLSNAAIPYNGDTINGTRWALGVFDVEAQERLFVGADYTEVDNLGSTEITLTEDRGTIRVVYHTSDTVSYPQLSHAAASVTRPAAIKGRDIEVRVGGNTVTDRWSSIQSVNVDWRVTLERDEELGNQNVIAQDFDVPEVSGTISLKTRDALELIQRVRQIAGVPEAEVVGTLQSVPLPMDIILHSPDDGSVLKTLYVPDVRFTPPGYSGQVQQKLTVDFPFESDGGKLSVFKGARA